MSMYSTAYDSPLDHVPPSDPTEVRCSVCKADCSPYPHTLSTGRRVMVTPHNPCDACVEVADRQQASLSRLRQLNRAGIPRKLQGYSLKCVEVQPDGVTTEAFQASVRADERMPVGILRGTESDLRRLYEWNPRERPNQWWFIEGPVGTGKSLHAAVVLMRHMGEAVMTQVDGPGVGEVSFAGSRTYTTAASYRPVFVEEEEFIERVKESWDGERGVLKRYAKAPLLAFDEFMPLKKVPDYWRQALSRLIRYRYDHALPTLFTSNEPISRVRDLYGPRVYDRMLERIGNRGGHIRLPGASWRQA